MTATRSPRRPPFVTSFLRTCAGVVVGSLSRASSSLPLARRRRDPKKQDAASDRRVHLGDAARADGRRVDVEHVAPVGPERRLEGALRVAPRVRRRPVLQMGEAVAERAREAVLARRGPLRELDGRRPRRARRPEAVAPPAVLVEAAEGGLRAVFCSFLASAGDAVAARRRNFADFADAGPRTESTSGVASAPRRIDVSTMRASRKHARARCCRTLASSSRSAPARRRCARIAVAGGGGGAASSMRARLALVMTQPPATAPTLTLRRRRCVPRGTTSGLAVLRTTSIFFAVLLMGDSSSRGVPGAAALAGDSPRREAEGRRRCDGRKKNRTHALQSQNGFFYYRVYNLKRFE